MIAYKPAYAKPLASLGQTPLVKPTESVPPPTIDPVFAGYEGLPGVLSTMAILAISGSALWVGIKAGQESTNKTMRVAGWVAGIGSALLGLFYVASKTGLTVGTGIPAVNVYPS